MVNSKLSTNIFECSTHLAEMKSQTRHFSPPEGKVHVVEGNFGHLGDRLSMVSFEEQDSFAKATIEMQLHPAATGKKFSQIV